MSQNPVIVIPGITGTSLADYYPISVEEVWTAVLRKEYERITLHPDDLRYEAREPARVLATNPFPLAYGDLVEALRYDLTKTPEKPTPVFAFGYDWRKDNFQTAEQLGLFIDEVLARTNLLPHYKKDSANQVDLVAHSMGGLVLTIYLHQCQTQKIPTKVGKVVTVATPFRGSIDAIRKVTTGMGELTGPLPRDRERETARMMPSLYQLLPNFENAVTGKNDESIDLFEADNWQQSILDTMGSFIRRIGADIEAKDLLKNFLTNAKELAQTANGLDLNNSELISGGRSGWLAIVGLGAKTSLNAKIEFKKNQPVFVLPDPNDQGANSEDTGDGIVPFLGACPGFLPREQLVGVTPDDLSIWEIQDKTMLATAGFHATLPNVNLVQRLIIRHLSNTFRGETWGRPVPGVTETDWPNWLQKKNTP
ncbi:alpha/beta hydrolase [Nitrosomonas sp. Is35]|uniref:lipase family alpha/beta hydrolase n=1 Tax=unclassified Nitrosomonas TaxID=2609265 RepID=UPI00294ABA4F|nr:MULTISPECIES: alpha/beta hydrolase [unclassified Nitrosomonas]MDV6342653.1 alpha/beta hydrolase [Nitrosomonas sp. Is24]MDV6348553.1 alpha/beta hydrolase [Nitrosomonas sp. Is35]